LVQAEMAEQRAEPKLKPKESRAVILNSTPQQPQSAAEVEERLTILEFLEDPAEVEVLEAQQGPHS
jgi:hypothetical protein